MTSDSPHRGLTGRVALVTGASRRDAIGAAVVRRLAADGAAVLVHSWSAHDVERGYHADQVTGLLEELRAGGAKLEHVSVDLADPKAPEQLVTAAHDAFGRLDILIANHARSSSLPLEDLTATEIDLTYAVNTRATLLLVKEFAARHDGQAGGRVVLFTSGQYHGAMPDELPYVASKGALHELTGSLAAHLMPRGIAVNCISPGPNNTGYGDEDLWMAVSARNPGGRASTPRDAARLVGWLVSNEADWVAGQTIASDGGWSTLGA